MNPEGRIRELLPGEEVREAEMRLTRLEATTLANLTAEERASIYEDNKDQRLGDNVPASGNTRLLRQAKKFLAERGASLA